MSSKTQQKKKKKRKFQIFTANGSPMHPVIEAEQISQEESYVGFYDASVDGNSRRLTAYLSLLPGYSVRETSE